MPDQIIAHDHNGESRRADVLLRARIDQAESGHINRARQNAGRHVRYQRYVAHIRYPVEFDTTNGLVRRVMYIGCILVQFPGIEAGYVRCIPVGVARRHVHIAEFLRFADRLLRPLTRIHVVRREFAAQQVQRNHRELLTGTALQEQHFVVGRYAHQLAQIGFGLRLYAHVFLAAMRHLHHRHAAAVPVGQFFLRLLQNFFGQNCRTRAEVVNRHAVLAPSFQKIASRKT